MSTRGNEKTGKIADARQEVALARQKVEDFRADLFAEGGDFEEKAGLLRNAQIDLARKEERFEAVRKKMGALRDDRQLVRVFLPTQSR